MARPAETEKRRDLAQRAVVVLQRAGLNLGMAELARELGIKRPTLLYHFPSLSHIVEHALEELLTEQMHFVLGRRAETDDAIERLYVQLRAVHEFHRGREDRIVFLSQAIAATAGERMEAIVGVGNRVFEAHREAAADRIRKGIAAGDIAPCDADALVVLIRALADGLLLQRVMTGVDLQPAHEMLWNNLLAPLRVTDKTTNEETSQ